MTLPKDRRITADYDFKKIRRRGKKIDTAFFSLYFLRTSPAMPARFGVVVSTKIDKRATKRNRIRRLFGESIRSLLPQIKDGFDLVFWVRQRTLESDPKHVQMAIRKMLMKEGLLADE